MFRKGSVRCTFSSARSRLSRKVILAGGVATILPMTECGTPSPTSSRDIWTVVRTLSPSSVPRSLETECTPILQRRPMYRSFAAKKMKAHTESHSLDAYTTSPLSRTTREALFDGAAAGPDLQAHNRAVLQDRFQSAVVPGSHITA